MVTHASTYEILRKLDHMEEGGDSMDRPDKIRLARDRANILTQTAFDRNKRVYNLRARKIEFSVGQIVFRRNFKQSKAADKYNAKLDLKFVKCKVRKKISSFLYELENLQGKRVGVYHTKDIRT